MSRVFVTGDIHQGIDIHKLSNNSFKIGKELNRNDVLIIAGDVGLVWNYGKAAKGEEKYCREWLSNKPYMILGVTGNHECFPLIEEFPIVDFYDGKARKISDNIYYEIRGEVYNIGGKTILTCDGADSHDKEFRREGVSWWPQERVQLNDIIRAIKNIKKYNYKIDYFITHSPGGEMTQFLGFEPTISDRRVDIINNFLPKIKHYCGHMHVDKSFKNHRCLFDDIVEIGGESIFE